MTSKSKRSTDAEKSALSATLEMHPTVECFQDILTRFDEENPKNDITVGRLLKKKTILKHPDGRILDDPNFVYALDELSITPEYEIYNGDNTTLAIMTEVLFRNPHIRNVGEDKLAMIASFLVHLKELYPGENIESLSLEEAATLLHIDVKSIEQAIQVYEKGCDSLVQAVMMGLSPVSVALKIARLPRSDQEVVADYLWDSLHGKVEHAA